MTSPADFLEHDDYTEEDVNIESPKNVLKILSCEEWCKDINEKKDFLTCVKNTINSQPCRSKFRSRTTWPAIERINALEIANQIISKRNDRMKKQKLQIGQHVTLQNMNKSELNGRSAYIIGFGLNEDNVIVITNPNEGKPIQVNKKKCKIEPWKPFEFDKNSLHYQAFPLNTPAPPGLSFIMSFDNSGYNLYKKG